MLPSSGCNWNITLRCVQVLPSKALELCIEHDQDYLSWRAGWSPKTTAFRWKVRLALGAEQGSLSTPLNMLCMECSVPVLWMQVPLCSCCQLLGSAINSEYLQTLPRPCAT